ncbi:MAG: YobA family protein, partial [Erysipelotrichaceae bacterium]|nr:YobA family protein [Erysipelotrichaceae bacterium]
GCNHRSMNYIIDHEPSIVGIVEEVYESYILINIKSEEYLKGQDCKVSLEVENKDSYTEISVGDEVFVYYDGNISESDPLQINTVYAITLKTPANR